MESQYFGHEHPLVLNEEQSNQSEAVKCSRCGEVMWSPSFCCAESECGFYLHKQCAEAPSQINHPFHTLHPLSLLPNPTYKGGSFICSFCNESGEKFVFHCVCEIDLHIKCALFTYNMIEELKGIDYIDPAISTENENKELASAKCFGCLEPLVDSAYYFDDRGFNVHKKCVELPREINYSCHPKHPLILQFSSAKFPCTICGNSDAIGFFYRCLPCSFTVHIGCLSPPPVIEDKDHEHPFTLFFRQILFTCDGCGVEGNYVPYICSNRRLLLHKRCISLPPIIKSVWHEHPLSHTYSFQRDESKSSECLICRNEVNTDYGSYNCSDCHLIVHVNCALEREYWYLILGKLDDYSALLSDESINSFTVIEQNKDGKATKIKHFVHQHDLILCDSDKIIEDDKYCDGCTLSISGSFYYCSKCDFSLHKLCAEFPKKKDLWRHQSLEPLVLTPNYIFRCSICGYFSNGLLYECDATRSLYCLRCVIPDTLTCKGHEHPLSYYMEYEGKCNACGSKLSSGYRCKKCNFALHWNCLGLPHKVGHKCDEHVITLIYEDSNIYSEHHFCDICEKDRNPSHWFYGCAICDTNVHTECAIGRYAFVKLGTGVHLPDKHQHAVTFVKKMYYYPKCSICGDPCQDLAVECTELECQFIAHWECYDPSWSY